MNNGNGSLPVGLFLPKHIAERLQWQQQLEMELRKNENPDPVPIEGFKELRAKPEFTLTFDLDGMTIGKFYYEDRQLKFEGNIDESAKIWVDWVIKKFMEWHDEMRK